MGELGFDGWKGESIHLYQRVLSFTSPNVDSCGLIVYNLFQGCSLQAKRAIVIWFCSPFAQGSEWYFTCIRSMPMKEDNPYNPLNESIAPDIPRRRGADFFIKLCVVAALLFVLVGLMLPAVRTARLAARRMQCAKNLKQISLALLNYHEKYGSFPSAFTVDDDGNLLHSWRTMIPFLWLPRRACRRQCNFSIEHGG